MMKVAVCCAVCAALIFSVLGAIPAQGAGRSEKGKKPFATKLGVHMMGEYTPGSQVMMRSRMPVLKILDPWEPMLQAARDYKEYNPDGVVVLRCYDPRRYSLEDNPEESAREYWEEAIWARLAPLSEEDRKLIDYIEGSNERDNCPTFEDLESIRWFVRFSNEFSRLVHEAGFKPCIGSIPVGNPSGPPEEVRQQIIEYIPALRYAHKLGGAWSYHNYTIKYTTDIDVEIHYSLRYRRFYDIFQGEYADLADMPMILTEGGVDLAADPDEDGWQARGTAEDYKYWLQWIDSEMMKDNYIIGCTLFQNGDPYGWQSFGLEPIAKWLAWWANEGSRKQTTSK